MARQYVPDDDDQPIRRRQRQTDFGPLLKLLRFLMWGVFLLFALYQYMRFTNLLTKATSAPQEAAIAAAWAAYTIFGYVVCQAIDRGILTNLGRAKPTD